MTSDPKSETRQRPAIPATATAWLAVAALVVALLAVAAAVFAWYQVAVTGRLEVSAQRSVVDRIAGELDGIARAQEGAGEKIESLATRLGELESATDAALTAEARARSEALDDFRGEFDRLAQSLAQVYEDLGRSVDSWMLEEAEQLLLLANQRLQLSRDTGLATTALRLADEKLAEIGDPSLIPVRGRIADELAALGALPDVDVAGAALRIEALLSVVGEMPLSGDLERPEWEFGEAVEAADAKAAEGGIGAFARGMLDDLGNLVRIRRVDETRLPRLKPVQRFLVHENLRLTLSAAQLALLRGDVELYRRNIDAAREWTGRYYDAGAEPVRRFDGELESLAALPLTRELPPIDGSLELLRETIAKRKPQ